LAAIPSQKSKAFEECDNFRSSDFIDLQEMPNEKAKRDIRAYIAPVYNAGDGRSQVV
jgi:hypothetical protein